MSLDNFVIKNSISIIHITILHLHYTLEKNKYISSETSTFQCVVPKSYALHLSCEGQNTFTRYCVISAAAAAAAFIHYFKGYGALIFNSFTFNFTKTRENCVRMPIRDRLGDLISVYIILYGQYGLVYGLQKFSLFFIGIKLFVGYSLFYFKYSVTLAANKSNRF